MEKASKIKWAEDIVVPRSLSMAFKTRGFDEPCIGVYDGETFLLNLKSRNSTYKRRLKMGMRLSPDDYCTAPTWEQVDKWLRGEKGIYGTVYSQHPEEHHYSIKKFVGGMAFRTVSRNFRSFEECRNHMYIDILSEGYKE